MLVDIRRWNYQTHDYEQYQPDPRWIIVLYSEVMDLPINCTNCGKAMVYGQGYTSKELHDHVGFGYPVCENCYEQELERDRASRNA